MKRYICLIPLLLAVLPLFAQFTLSGSIRGYDGKAPLSVNIPSVYGFHKENTLPVQVSDSGTFHITLPADSMQFASLIFQRQFYTLLMQPGEKLQVELDGKARYIRFTGGDRIVENRVLQSLGMDEAPFFWERDSLGALPANDLRKSVTAPYLQEQNRHIQTILASHIPCYIKQLFISELKYHHLNYLNDFLRTSVSDRNTMNELLVELFDAVSIIPESPHPGPQYFTFTDNYIRYLETKAFIRVKKENIPASAPIPYFGISLDSANVIVAKYGKPYWRWIGSIANFPPEIAEAYNWQQIQNQYLARDLSQAESLAGAFRHQFPHSRYNAGIEKMIATLQNQLKAQAGNDKIVVVEDGEQTGSIQQILGRLKGKVVYLDVWGTWCGPCKEEIKHLPELHAEFAGQDVAFLFLAMDEDNRDAIWKEYIRVNGMEGVHFRKTRQAMAPFWKELLANHPDKSESYPQYFLFDKTGKLVVAKAKRPSDGAVLFRQIRDVMDVK